MKMISVEAAEEAISLNIPQQDKRTIGLRQLSTETLAQSLVADRNYPPFDRVAMDGIAIQYKKWQQGQRNFSVKGIQKAGQEQQSLSEDDACIEVMTGGCLPHNTDTVIRYEDVDINDGMAELKEIEVTLRQNIHFAGSDYKKGDELVQASCILRAPEWAVAASIGQTEVEVVNRPKIAIVSTGDELVAVDQMPLPHQIRLSNGHSLKAALLASGYLDVEVFHIQDKESELFSGLKEVFSRFDWVVLSGGVSMGKFDLVPHALTDLGVKEVFHKVMQKPGKPIWFGVSERSQPVFGLPGNPVSALVCLYRYVIPALKKSIGEQERKVFASLKEDFSFKKDLTYFLSVSVDFFEDGRIVASPVKGNGSGDFASLTRSDGFIELPKHRTQFRKGEAYPIYLWRAIC